MNVSGILYVVFLVFSVHLPYVVFLRCSIHSPSCFCWSHNKVKCWYIVAYRLPFSIISIIHDDDDDDDDDLNATQSYLHF